MINNVNLLRSESARSFFTAANYVFLIVVSPLIILSYIFKWMTLIFSYLPMSAMHNIATYKMESMIVQTLNKIGISAEQFDKMGNDEAVQIVVAKGTEVLNEMAKGIVANGKDTTDSK